jgi:sodium-dependent dicarboxylate transporter 2/3/5
VRTLLLRILGPALGALVYVLLRHLGPQPALMAGIVAWMAVWWISEAVPLAVTSLLPMVLFPVFGIDTVAGTTANYGKEIIYLFLGGFLLALAIERSGLHKRIALHIVARVGGTGPRLVGGMLIACALLSMWMNSTSCVLVMLPIALSLLDDEEAPAAQQQLTVPLLLAVAYGATIGGMATPVGTPPNLVFMEVWKTNWPDRPPIGFGQWMAFGVPFMLIFLAIAWLLLTRLVFRVPQERLVEPTRVRERIAALGRTSRDERLAGLVFALTALLWITGDGIRFTETMALTGWREWTGLAAVSDGAVAIACRHRALPHTVHGTSRAGVRPPCIDDVGLRGEACALGRAAALRRRLRDRQRHGAFGSCEQHGRCPFGPWRHTSCARWSAPWVAWCA